MDREPGPDTDWAAWSREAGRMMQARTNAWHARHKIVQGSSYRWDLERGTLQIAEVTARLCCVGSASLSEGTFLWAWANEAIVPAARAGLEQVREFGERHGLALLTNAEWKGGRPE